MSIKHWPIDERPREKLLQMGATHLTTTELLAIFIQSGLKGKTAVEVAREALIQTGSLRALLGLDLQNFCNIRGLGEARYVLLQAGLEIGRRYLQEAMLRTEKITNSQMIRQYLHARLRDEKSEVFACIFLDNRNHIIAFEPLFKGTIHFANIHPREIVKAVLQHNASAVIFAHNHPSGKAIPSEADQRLTHHLKNLLQLIEVRVIDHFIIGDNEMFSFAEEGHL